MSTQSAVPLEKMVFRKTSAHTGRHLTVTPTNSTMRHLSYGRIILNAFKTLVSFLQWSTGNRIDMPGRKQRGEDCRKRIQLGTIRCDLHPPRFHH
jgi:hypothetical protein